MRLKRILFFFVLITVPLFGTETDLEKAIKFRKGEEYAKAERLLKKYSSPAGFDALKSSEKIDFLRGLLELAHIRALKDDVSGSLSLLNWAEGRKEPYQRAIACVKYAEILLDLGEFERASGYLKNADEIIRNRATEEDTGAAIGQGGTSADTGAIWRDLRDESDALKADIESEEMKKKFGASYGNYVKLRRLQVLLKRSRTPRYMREAMRLADELMETDPASQFAAAAGYLKGEIMASRLKEESSKKDIKEVKEYLDKFVKQRPDGLYRGEALMLLGKISLEIEWNAKNAEKYYSQALDWFRKAREKRDAISLYAAMSDDLKQQSMPIQKPTSLNQWKNLVYHDEDPLKIYNTCNAPVWYMNDKEKDCYLWLGFVALSSANSVKAKKYWEKIQNLDENSGSESGPYPNLTKRLMSACRFNMFVLSPEELSAIKDLNIKLRLNFASMYYMMGRLDEADKIFSNIFRGTQNYEIKALCMLCRGGIAHIDVEKKEIAMSYFEWIMKQPQLKKSMHYGSAMFRYANALMGLPDGYNKALPLYREYLKNYKSKNRWDYYREAGYREIFCLILQKKFSEAKRKFEMFKREKEDSFVKELNYKFKVIKEKGEYL